MTQVIELTGKKLKFQIIFSTLAACISIVVIIIGFNKGQAMTSFIGVNALLASFAWHLVIRILIWWFHK